MRTDLGAEDLRDLLDQPIIAVLATRRRDDTIMLSPVWYEWRDGGFNVWVDTESSGKVAHIRRDPRVSLVVANQDWPYKGLELRGEATISADPALFYEVLTRTAHRYLGEERGTEMVGQYTSPGVVIRLEPGDVRGWDYGDDA